METNCFKCLHFHVCTIQAQVEEEHNIDNCKYFIDEDSMQEVVRCKECKYSDLCSIKESGNFKDNDYCCKGCRSDK